MEKNYYEIDQNIYQRFDQKNDMFCRYLWDDSLKTFRNNFANDMLTNIIENKEGYTHFDYAFSKASWTVYNRFPFAFSWEGDTSFEEDWYGYKLRERKYQIKDPIEFTAKVKKVARFYGASLVGITKLDEKWIYQKAAKRSAQKFLGSYPIHLPEGINRAIVIAIEMDSLGLSTTPALPACAATGLGYSKMALVISCLGEFIRNLGYQAIQCGNDTALSIPLAIDAGLGALGRNGLLVTPEYGPGVRICKVFTDLPLVLDKPNFSFISKLSNFCKRCYQCAEVCETKAISFKAEPDFKAVTISNNPGVKKYYINPEKCFEFWAENTSDCSKCITVCPFFNAKDFIPSNEFWNEK
ncbi:MAG TPA: 4Fe-4S dicluster domain-containing protein [Candidatus Atribacteria bacterium]|nr:4Fe-4S dicluster domain-containing protein [Candidatus Atribacteria bacterium]